MIIQNPKFREIKEKHAKELLYFLLDNTKDEFSILARLDAIKFNPILPEEIMKNFKEVILFVLANYTLSSAYIEDDNLIFEAGFGEENFASIVTIPIEAIIQILYKDTPLFINIAATTPKPKPQIENPFKLNPRNQKLFK